MSRLSIADVVLGPYPGQFGGAMTPSAGLCVTVVKGSFFTYSDKEDEYWSGYYTSRPFMKRLGRELESLLHAAEMLHTYRVAVSDQKAAHENHGEQGLQRARFAVALFQHHDAIT